MKAWVLVLIPSSNYYIICSVICSLPELEMSISYHFYLICPITYTIGPLPFEVPHTSYNMCLVQWYGIEKVAGLL